jgi:hypothetical protein
MLQAVKTVRIPRYPAVVGVSLLGLGLRILLKRRISGTSGLWGIDVCLIDRKGQSWKVELEEERLFRGEMRGRWVGLVAPIGSYRLIDLRWSAGFTKRMRVLCIPI